MPSLLRLLPLLAPLAAPGCIVDHDLFAVRADGAGGTRASSGGTGGTGRPSAAGAGGRDGGGADPASGGAGTGGAPDGPRRLTFLHGVIDAPTLFLCIAPVVDGREAPAVGAPGPASGLAYGKSVVLDATTVTGFRPYVIAAEAAAIAGLDCAMAIALGRAVPVDPGDPDGGLALGDAGRVDASMPVDAYFDVSQDATSVDGAPPEASLDAALDAVADARDEPPPAEPPIPAVRAAGLPIVPAAALVTERSYLFAVGGCLGGPGVANPSEKSVCGERYTPDNPTLTPYLVMLSRQAPTASVALQFLVATPAFPQADLSLLPASSEPLSVVADVPAGGLRPVPPFTSAGTTELRASDPESRIQIRASGVPDIAYDEPWSVTLSANDVPILEDTRGYTLVQIGPYPGFSKREWWNDPLVTIVRNDP